MTDYGPQHMGGCCGHDSVEVPPRQRYHFKPLK